MNFGELIYQQPENIKKLIRKIENLEKKLSNARAVILFNETCLNIYIYIKARQKSIYVYLNASLISFLSERYDNCLIRL